MKQNHFPCEIRSFASIFDVTRYAGCGGCFDLKCKQTVEHQDAKYVFEFISYGKQLRTT